MTHQSDANEDESALDAELAELELDEELAQLEAEDREYEKKKSAAEPSQLESAIRGGAKGITFGFADEGAARLMAAKQAAFGEDSGLSWDDLVSTNLAAVRRRDEKAQKANPVTFTGANVAGSVISPASKLIAPAKGATLATKMASGARAGALMGAGESVHSADEGFVPMALDAAKGAALGAGGAGVLQGGANLARKATPQNLNRLADKAKSVAENSKGFSLVDVAPAAMGLGTSIMQGGASAKSAALAAMASAGMYGVRKLGPRVAEKGLRLGAKMSEAVSKVRPAPKALPEQLTPGVFSMSAPAAKTPLSMRQLLSPTPNAAPYGLMEQALTPSPEELQRIELDRRMRRHQQALQDQGIPLRLESEESLSN